MQSVDPAPQTRAARRALQGPHGQSPARPQVAPVPRPVVAAGAVVGGLALALAALTTSAALLVAVVTAAGLVVALGLPRLAGLATPVQASGVLAVTALALAAARLATAADPWLEAAPVAAAVGIILMCLVPLVDARVRAELTRWLVTVSFGIGLLMCGIVLTIVAGDARRPLVVAGVAVAVSAVVDVLLEKPRLHAWMLPVAMLLGGLAGLVVTLVVSGQVLVWGLLVGVLSAGVALAARRLAAPLPRASEPGAAVAVGAASVLVVGPVVLTLTRAFLG